MTYEYICTNCGHQWEAEQPISADPLESCPSCNQSTAKRQVSGGQGFILKGGGWYADGYGSSTGASSETSDTTSGGKSDTKKSADTKSDSSGDTSSSKTKDKKKKEAAV